MFSPGETVIHNFVVPFLPTEISLVIVSYKQRGNIVLEKEVASEDIISQNTGSSPFDHTTIVEVELDQEDTLLFEDNVPFTIQVNVMAQSTRHASKELKGESGIQYHREVIGNG